MSDLILIDDRYFVHYKELECFKKGFYDKGECKHRDEHIKAQNLLESDKLFSSACKRVLNEWVISSRVNITNPHGNKKSWIGQSACFLIHNTCESCTKKAWNNMSLNKQRAANDVAMKEIRKWKKEVLEKEICQKQKLQLELVF